jgi:hypothetical protein
MRIRQGAWAAVAVVLVAGCGEKGPTMVSAGGTVLFNGEPLANANVVFVPEAGGPTSVGQTADDGKFTLSSSARPGAMVGKHQVAIQANERVRRDGKVEPAPAEEIDAESETKSPYISRSLIPRTYGDYSASGLTADVTEGGENQFTFELTGTTDRR